MPLILMIGPHAVGKTTAARRYAARYSGLRVAIADNQLEILNSREERVRGWKSTREEKQELTRRRMAEDVVTLVETGRGFSVITECVTPLTPVIVLTCPEPCGRAWLEERRARAGMGPLGAFWTPQKLGYECNAHKLNHARKHLSPDQYRHFVIEDRERDWPAVDEHFGALFRRVHNTLVRQRAEAGGGDLCRSYTWSDPTRSARPRP